MYSKIIQSEQCTYRVEFTDWSSVEYEYRNHNRKFYDRKTWFYGFQLDAYKIKQSILLSFRLFFIHDRKLNVKYLTNVDNIKLVNTT